MAIKFDPQNPIIKLCMMGIFAEENGDVESAYTHFQNAWKEASDDYEKFIAAFHVSRIESQVEDRIKWLKISLECAKNFKDDNVMSAFSRIYLEMAKCYDALEDKTSADECRELASQHKVAPKDKGPFYHGTKANLSIGDLLVAGGNSNYKDDLKMNHIYFTANLNGAGLAAALAKGEGDERIYIVEPTGAYEDDPNVTDKKLPGNLTRSYRSVEPLKIIDEVSEWIKLSPSEKLKWKEDIDKKNGEIIN